MQDRIKEWIERSCALGFVGEPATKALEHSRAFALVLRELEAQRWVDLGSGGGIPGLALAVELETTNGVLVEAKERRVAFLEEAVRALGLDDRVQVWGERGELAGRSRALRECADAVVARSFGAPAVTAELAAPLVRVGGAVVVSEPPDSNGARWVDRDALAELGLGSVRIEAVDGRHFAIIAKVSPTSDRFPRRVGIPEKRPLFR
jgi:16S rRNA (guanine527-N7)-methyltransferase